MLTPSEIDLIADAVADRLAARIGGHPQEQLLDAYQVSELLECSLSTVERLTATGELPSRKYGRLRRYLRAEILATNENRPEGDDPRGETKY